MKLYSTLLKIFKILSNDDNLSFLKNNKVEIYTSNNISLLHLTNKTLDIPVEDLKQKFLKHKSKVKDHFVDLALLKSFIENLSSEKKIVRLNHVGFCYKVDSINDEVNHIVHSIQNSELHVYEEPSSDDAKWIFIGNLRKWDSTLLELLPIESTTDEWVDYWLPHIQIDIDTSLSPEEIISKIKHYFGDRISPYEIVIEGIVYIVRCRLGIVDGVNINLDLATKNRQVKYHHENILKLIV